MRARATVGVASVAMFLITAPVSGQTAPQSSPTAPSQSQRIGIRGFFEAGASWLAAKESFEAITGGARATPFGGGVQVTNLWRGLFAQVSVSRATTSGERVFVHDGTRFQLGIPVDITMMPIEATAGYRFALGRGRVIPYAGGGMGSFGYRERSPFSESGENVDERFGSWHVLGGVEVPIVRWLAVGGEFHYRAVPDALGEGGVSEAFGENDLGGTSLRLRISVGR